MLWTGYGTPIGVTALVARAGSTGCTTYRWTRWGREGQVIRATRSGRSTSAARLRVTAWRYRATRQQLDSS